MSKERTCHICKTVTDTWCDVCLAAFRTRKAAAEMTPEERGAEMRLLSGPLEIPFNKVHQRIEELVGRPVWTHEMASFDALIAEAEGKRERATMQEVIEKIPAEKRIVVRA